VADEKGRDFGHHDGRMPVIMSQEGEEPEKEDDQALPVRSDWGGMP